MSKVIEKKMWPESYEKVLSGEKTYDLRLADWTAKPGDTVVFKEWDPKAEQYTGREIRRRVGYVGKTKDWEVWPKEDIERCGFQVISLLPEDKNELGDLQERALEIRRKYNLQNAGDGFDAWGGKEYAMGFVGDVGDLLKIVMAKENLRRMDDIDAKLKHELGDCLWSLFVIANHYGIDLGAAFKGTMSELDKRLADEN